MAVTGKLGCVLVSTAIVVSIANPVMATHDAEHAKQQIAQIVDQAATDRSIRVTTLEADLGTASTRSEIEAMHREARSDVNDIWAKAKSDVENLGRGYNSELSAEISEAKQILISTRNQAQADIDTAAAASVQKLADSITTTTSHLTTTTSETAVSTGEDPPDPAAGETPPETQTPLERWANQAFVAGHASSPEISSSNASRSGIAVALETVLPRDLIDWAMSPFRILVLIVRTTVNGGRSILLPAAALALAAAVLVGLEARSRRVAASRR